MDKTDEDLQQLIDWIISNGGYIDKNLSLRRDPKNGVSMCIVSPLPSPANPQEPPKPHRLVSCPTKLTFSLKTTPSLFPPAFDDSQYLTPHSKLCFRLCSHFLLGKESKYWPYIRLLPETFDTPLYFTPEELKLLEGTNLGGEDVESRRVKWTKEWTDGVAVLKSLRDTADVGDVEDYTWPLYLRAATTISSRAFPSRLLNISLTEEERRSQSSDDTSPILIPLLDSANHALASVIWTHHTDTDCVSIYSTEDVSKWKVGDEVYNNYGPKGNEEFLMQYGFCVKNNPGDYVSIKFKIPPLPPAKQALLPPAGEWGEGVFHIGLKPNVAKVAPNAAQDEPLPLNAHWPGALLNVFRIIVAKNEELAWTHKVALISGQQNITTTRIELAVATQLHGAALAKYAGLVKNAIDDQGKKIRPLSYQKGQKPQDTRHESEEPTAEEVLSPRKMAAKIYRDGQIKILTAKLYHLDHFLSKFRIDHRMTPCRCAADSSGFGAAVEAQFGRDMHDLSSDEQDEVFAVGIVRKYLAWIHKALDENDADDQWWEKWLGVITKPDWCPYPYHARRIAAIERATSKSKGKAKATEPEDMHTEEDVVVDEECDEPYAMHVYEDVVMPMCEAAPEIMHPEWKYSGALIEWGFDLLAVTGTEVEGEVCIAL